jgi:hypothetical protein
LNLSGAMRMRMVLSCQPRRDDDDNEEYR